MERMTPEEAWLYAAQWGSCMRPGDPGACMYGFNEKCRPQSEKHRQDCLDHIDKECVPTVQESPAHFDTDELEKLQALREYLASAPLMGQGVG